MRRATIPIAAILCLAFAETAFANPDCYYDQPRIREVALDGDQLRIRGDCLVEPYNPIPKVSLGNREPLQLLRAEENEVVVAAPELATGEHTVHLQRGYHRERFGFAIAD